MLLSGHLVGTLKPKMAFRERIRPRLRTHRLNSGCHAASTALSRYESARGMPRARYCWSQALFLPMAREGPRRARRRASGAAAEDSRAPDHVPSCASSAVPRARPPGRGRTRCRRRPLRPSALSHGPDDLADDVGFLGEAAIGLIVGAEWWRSPDGSAWGSTSTRLTTSPEPSQSTTISPVSGLRRAMSTSSRSPSEISGSMESPRARSTSRPRSRPPHHHRASDQKQCMGASDNRLRTTTTPNTA